MYNLVYQIYEAFLKVVTLLEKLVEHDESARVRLTKLQEKVENLERRLKDLENHI